VPSSSRWMRTIAPNTSTNTETEHDGESPDTTSSFAPQRS
jgi:hypothetical protein